jgi:hypothetical protein
MPTIFDNRDSMDQTVRIYDQFYNVDVVVNAAEFDIVFGFFQTICATTQIAANYTSFLFRVSSESGIPIMQFMEDLNKMKTDKMLVNSFLAFYLNKFRSKTNLYGVSTVPRPVQPVARNVVQ